MKFIQKKFFMFIFGIGILCFTSGCATMISGTSEPVTINSEPDGATIYIGGQIVGKTPSTISLKRKSDQTVELVKEGYKRHVFTLETTFNPWVLTNVIWCFACPLSTTTDYSSGAAYQYSPNQYFVSLVSKNKKNSSLIDPKQSKAKLFILGNYKMIMTDLNKVALTNTNEYLNALFVLLETPEHKRELAREQIKTISNNTRDILKFANEVVNTLNTNTKL